MGRYYFMIIIAALILMAFAAIGLAMNARQHRSHGTAVSSSNRSSTRSGGRSWWLTHRHPQGGVEKALLGARIVGKPD